MALVDIGSITATRSSSTTYTAILDDNVVKKIFYPLNIGFSVALDASATSYVPSSTYTAILDDNVVKKIFYPLNIGFSVVADTLALPNETFRRLNNYIYWS
jgi:hypothetical protein